MTKHKSLLAAVLIVCLTMSMSWAQIQTPYTYSNKNPSPNAPGGNCFTNTQPVYNYLLSTYWYCVPNTSPPTNLGTWTSYSLPTGILAINSLGQPISATLSGTGTTIPTVTGPTITSATLVSPTISGTPTGTAQSIVIPLTLSQLQTLFTVGVQILPVPAATSMYVMGPCVLNLTYGSAAFTGGGAVSIGYGNTYASTTPSPLTHGTIAATVFTTFSASHGVVVIPAAVAVTETTGLAGKAVFMSAATQDFAAGTGGTGQVSCQYSVVTGVS